MSRRTAGTSSGRAGRTAGPLGGSVLSAPRYPPGTTRRPPGAGPSAAAPALPASKRAGRGGRERGSEHLGEEGPGPLVLGVAEHLAGVAGLHHHAAVHEHQAVADLA